MRPLRCSLAPRVAARVPLVLAAASPAFAQICLEDRPPTSLHAPAVAAASADMDGDGKADLVTVGERPKVSVWRSLGDGSFVPGSTEPIGSGPAWVTTADLNRDGMPDVVTANQGSSSLSVLFNLGGGRLAPEVRYPIGNPPSRVIAADLDYDGVPDLVATCPEASTIYVSLNRGNGTFGAMTPYSVGSFPGAATCADLDGDRFAEIAVADSTDVVWILPNRGDGTFGAPSPYRLEGNPIGIAHADVDGDGDEDLAVVANRSSSVSVFVNRGDGTFGEPVPFPALIEPSTLASEDLDLDGRPDLVVTSGYRGVAVLANRGTGRFEPAVKYDVYVPVSALGDADGDGDLDLLGAVGSWAFVLANPGDGTLVPFGDSPAGRYPTSIASGDLDGDGAPDLVVTNPYDSETNVLLNLGDGSFASPVAYSLRRQPCAVAIGDLDGDGDADLAVVSRGQDSNSSQGFASILLNEGDGSLRAAAELEAGYRPCSVACADLDRDGDLDLAVSEDSGHGDVIVLLNHGDGTFAPAASYHVGSHLPSLACADFDGDGYPDLAVTTTFFAPITLTILRNRGDGSFEVAERHPMTNPLAVASADFDGDGHPDLAVTAYPHSMTVFLNRGDGTFREAGAYETEWTAHSLVAADLDGDGRPEIVVGDFVSVFRNRGNGRFDAGVTYAAGGCVATDDFDRDGDVDVAAGVGYAVSTLRNCREAGIVYCAGDGSTPACPCGNWSPPGLGVGCLNSHAVGAALRASGSARLARDEAVLEARDLLGSAVVFVQGTERRALSFGDGIFCTGGVGLRLATTSITSGVALYPGPGDPALSVKGRVLVPGKRTYQAVYRDAASFCTPSAFNLTNGLELTWAP